MLRFSDGSEILISRPKDQATQGRALGLKILGEKKTSKKLIWL